MNKIVLVSFALLFFFMGHSTLLYFEEQGKTHLSMSEVLMPRPKNGRFVSGLCFFIAILFLLGAIFIPPGNTAARNVFMFVLIFVAFPWLFYFSYIIRGLERIDDKLFFTPKKSDGYWKVPIILSTAISFIAWITSKG